MFSRFPKALSRNISATVVQYTFIAEGIGTLKKKPKNKQKHLFLQTFTPNLGATGV